jgi:hypothetical protein
MKYLNDKNLLNFENYKKLHNYNINHDNNIELLKIEKWISNLEILDITIKLFFNYELDLNKLNIIHLKNINNIKDLLNMFDNINYDE